MSNPAPGTVSRNRPLTKGEAKSELTAWSSSGLSLAAYARERGIPEKRMWNWRTRLRAQGWEPGIAGQENSAGLVPARIIDSAALGTRSAFDLSLAAGIVIRVPSDFDKNSLRRLLEVVSEC